MGRSRILSRGPGGAVWSPGASACSGLKQDLSSLTGERSQAAAGRALNPSLQTPVTRP